MMSSFEFGTKLTVLKPTVSEDDSIDEDFGGEKVWIKEYFPKKEWIPGEIVGQKGRCIFVGVRRQMVKKKRYTDKETFYCSDFSVLSDDLVDWSAPPASHVSLQFRRLLLVLRHLLSWIEARDINFRQRMF